MLDVRGVLLDPLDQVVVVVVGVGAERLVALEHDHGRTVGVELAELLADVFDGLERGRIGRAERDVVGFADDLELGNQDIGEGGDGDPEQHDGHSEQPDRVGDPARRGLGRGLLAGRHPDLSRQ